VVALASKGLIVTQQRLDRLFEALNGYHSILILPHNDPDPDAIASAVALRYLLIHRLGMQADIAYKGMIGRAENKALVRYLNHPLRRLTNLNLRQPVPKALVDTQLGAGNNALPAKSTAAIVIDHHPWREETATVAFADVRSDVGASSSILTEYLQAADVVIPSSLATALFYGIKTDTMGLGRAGSPTDAAAYFYLQPLIDADALVEIERAQVPVEYFRSFDTALHSVRAYDGLLIAYIGRMAYPDQAAEMADLLLRLEGTRWMICIGVYQDELIVSVRARGRQGGAGKLAQHLVGERGTAGGHGTMAAAHFPLDGGDPEQLAQQIGQRALEFLKVPPEETGKPLI